MKKGQRNKPSVNVIVVAALTFLIFSSGVAQVKVLVYRGFFGYEHSALRTATAVIQNELPTLIEDEPAFTVDTAISPSAMTGANLNQYDVVVLNNNTGIGGLSNPQRSALMDFSKTKGIVALHSTADFKGGASWPEMVGFIGGSLSGHTARMADLHMDPDAADHPINEGLGPMYSMNDEWYGYAANPRDVPGTTILWTLDEESMDWSGGGDMPGNDHGIAWCRQTEEGGRMFYTAQAHRDSIMERNVHARRLVYNAILWVANAEPVEVAVQHPIQNLNGDVTYEPERNSLKLRFHQQGEHSYQIHSMDGRRVAYHKGRDAKVYQIPGLKTGQIYIVSGHTTKNKFSQKIFMP